MWGGNKEYEKRRDELIKQGMDFSEASKQAHEETCKISKR